MPSFKIGKTVLNGLKRAIRINIQEVTDDDDIQDAVAKAIKLATRAIIVITLAKLFPDEVRLLFSLIAP